MLTLFPIIGEDLDRPLHAHTKDSAANSNMSFFLEGGGEVEVEC
jgi:hypothetical protein